MSTDPIPFPPIPGAAKSSESAVLGSWLVIGSAIAWSFGGTIDRFISATDTWTVVFWRSVFASSFLIVFLLFRDGRQAVQAFRQMGWPGLVVALCFMTASISALFKPLR